jgi:hypothetical protein
MSRGENISVGQWRLLGYHLEDESTLAASEKMATGLLTQATQMTEHVDG